MNSTLLRLSTQALFGRRRGVVLLLIAGALLVLAVFVRLLTDEEVGRRGGGRARLHAGAAARRPARRDGRARPRDRRRLGRLPARETGEPARHRGEQVRRGVGRHDGCWARCRWPSRPLVLDPSQPGRAAPWPWARRCPARSTPRCSSRLAALTRHAVVVGLLFVLVWEGVLGSIFAGVRWLSIGAWGRAVAGEISPPVEDAANIGLAYARGGRGARHRRRPSGSPATGCARSRCAGTSRVFEPRRRSARSASVGGRMPEHAVALMQQLHDEHAAALWGYCLRLTGQDRARAEDVVQETLLRAWRNHDRLDESRGLGAVVAVHRGAQHRHRRVAHLALAARGRRRRGARGRASRSTTPTSC